MRGTVDHEWWLTARHAAYEYKRRRRDLAELLEDALELVATGSMSCPGLDVEMVGDSYRIVEDDTTIAIVRPSFAVPGEWVVEIRYIPREKTLDGLIDALGEYVESVCEEGVS